MVVEGAEEVVLLLLLPLVPTLVPGAVEWWAKLPMMVAEGRGAELEVVGVQAVV
jgi:hypothetical protein